MELKKVLNEASVEKSRSKTKKSCDFFIIRLCHCKKEDKSEGNGVHSMAI